MQNSAIIKTLDEIVSRIVRARDIFCQFPGCSRRATDCGHCFGRRMMSVRFDPEDCMGFCREHHGILDNGKDQQKKFSLFRDKLGAEKYRNLEARARSIRKWLPFELRELRKQLIKLIK